MSAMTYIPTQVFSLFKQKRHSGNRTAILMSNLKTQHIAHLVKAWKKEKNEFIEILFPKKKRTK